MIDVGGYRLRLRYLLGFQAFALQHVLEVHVAADIKLICAVEHHAAILEEPGQNTVGNRRADLALNRSEEHTSELQSRFDLVCRLLLEKEHMHERPDVR